MCQLNCATDVFWRGTMKIKSSPMPMFVNMEKKEKGRECVFSKPEQTKPNQTRTNQTKPEQTKPAKQSSEARQGAELSGRGGT